MSDLYKEALADAKKLREIAEEDARKAIMEKVSPYIKKMIAKETARATNFFFEEEEPNTERSEDLPPPITSSMEASAEDTDLEPVLSNPSTSPPISVTGSDVANIPLPDASGKITIDIEDLFDSPSTTDTVSPVDTSAIAPGEELNAAPSEVQPPIQASAEGATETGVAGTENVLSASENFTVEGEEEEENENMSQPENLAESLGSFNKRLNEVSFSIDRAYYSNGVPGIVQERLKNKLIGLLESVDRMLEKGIISERQARLNEKRLEFLFLKLKEASLANSYIAEKDEKEEPMGKSLKEYAAKLFESEDQERLEMDSLNTGDTGVPIHKSASATAKEKSGISPEVDDLFKEEVKSSCSKTMDKRIAKSGTVDFDALPNTGKAHKKPWHDAEPSSISEEVEVEGHAGFGDSDEEPVASPDMFFTIDEKELMEAISDMKKKANNHGWEGGTPKGKPMSPKDAMKDRKMSVKEQTMHGGGMDEDLVLNVDLPDEIEDELDADDLDVDLMFSKDDDDMEDLSDEDLSDEEDEDALALVDDDTDDDDVDDLAADEEEEEEDLEDDLEDEEIELEDEDDSSSSEEKMLLTDDEDEELTEVKDTMGGSATGRGAGGVPMKEHRLARLLLLREKKARKLIESARSETRTIKKEMAETNLLLSKLLYLNKFLQREGLSRKVKQQIVEHLDRATTLAEAKDIYLRIKKKLDEAEFGSSSVTRVGSASKPITQGSARLTESAYSTTSMSVNDNSPVIGTFERWQKLARIRKNDD
jgi:hypothetical protein